MSGFRALLSQIAEDYRAHGRDWTKPGFRTIAVHRFGVWRMEIRPALFRAPFSLLYRMAFRHCRNVYGIELPYSVPIGRRVIIEHQGGIVVHGASVIGDDCIIRQNCTLGIRSLARLDDAPVLEAGVSVGAGATILGKVTIGKGAAIGANAVVLVDVPAGTIAVGNPARIVSKGA
jgi:serine O-acetyltransferase